jgi:hypothetical protein
MTLSLAMLATMLTPAARRWRHEQTAAEERIMARERLIRMKTCELEDAVSDYKRTRIRLDLIIRAGRKLRVPENVAAAFGRSLDDLSHRITGHD